MASSEQIPVVVGVADVIHRSRKVEDAREPLDLILEAVNKAINDACPSQSDVLKSQIDSVDVVRTWTWPYPDLASLVSGGLGVDPKRREVSEHGGNQPGKVLDDAARRIAKGENRVAVLTGGEALASLTACAAAGELPPRGWTKLDQDIQSVFSPTTRELEANLGSKHGIGNPIHVYPLYENALRASRGQTIQENHSESAQLYADFAKVAEGNPYAWSYGQPATTADAIETVTTKNRMICMPYPLLMNAFNAVNLAAAVVVTSASNASELGIPQSQWIYPLGGAGTRDSGDFWKRPNFYQSPAISQSLDASLQATGLKTSEIDLFDLYSCFPVVPKIAALHLGLPILHGKNRLTLLGGLTSFGGAGNNYGMHAITEMARQLRAGKGKTGLVLANGGVVTYQHVVVLSSQPPVKGHHYPVSPPLPETSGSETEAPRIAEQAKGDATIETYTVEFSKSGKPKTAYIVGRLKTSGERTIANHADQRTLEELASWSKEPVGRSGRIWTAEDGRNVFAFEDNPAKL